MRDKFKGTSVSQTTRVIKKYANRRLYDTVLSRYITLDDIKELVLKNIQFCVIDAHTQADITKTTLLQIISAHEESGSPIFTIQLLEHWIRSYNNNIHNLLSHFLEQAMNYFVQQQENYQRLFLEPNFTNPNPLLNMRELFEFQKDFLDRLSRQYYPKEESNVDTVK